MKKRIISLLLAVIMIIGIMPLSAIPVFAESFTGSTYYGLKDGKITELDIPENAVDITLDTDFSQGGVFILRESVTFGGKILLGGDTTIILCDHAVLTSKGIGAPANGNLTICATTLATDETAGKISVETPQDDWYATCIGTQEGDSECGDITIVGGVFDLTTLEEIAAIGGKYSSCGDINIFGGKINITLKDGGAGIGIAGGDSSCGDINIFGGIIDIKMIRSYCCGIGCEAYDSTLGSINIMGGDIKIEALCYSNGIGLKDGTCEDINISGGKIDIKIGQESVGIGALECKCKNITVSGGNIKISYQKAESPYTWEPEEIIAGIGVFAGDDEIAACGNITLEGGNIDITFLPESGSVAVGAAKTEGKYADNSAKCGKISENPFYNKFSGTISATESRVQYLEQRKDFASKPATCGENGYKASFYNSADGSFYEDNTFTKKIGTFGDLYRWAINGNGIIPATGEHVDDGNGICQNCGKRISLPKVYYGLDGEELVSTAVPANAVALTGEETELTGNTYVVADDVTYDGRIIFTEDTLLILCENKTLTAEGISVVNGHSLTIASTTPDKDEMGKIVIADYLDDEDEDEYYEKMCIAAIGSYTDPASVETDKAPDDMTYYTAGNITVLGGIIEFDYDEYPAEVLIGAGYFSACGDINIYGGYIKVDTVSWDVGVGIGASYCGTCGDINIYGGDIEIGTVNYVGIGATDYGTCGNINICGGETMIGTVDSDTAIGAGETAKCGNITVSEGVIEIDKIVDGVGIGAHYSDDTDKYCCGNIAITGGRIKIEEVNDGVGIGAIGKCGKITVNGGDITIEGLISSTGIGAYATECYRSGGGTIEYSGTCNDIEITGGKVYITTYYEDEDGEISCGNDSVAIGAGKRTYKPSRKPYVTINTHCGDILISDGDIEIYVPITKDGELFSGDGNNNVAIGAADGSKCGEIVIGSSLVTYVGENSETAVIAPYTNQKYVYLTVPAGAAKEPTCTQDGHLEFYINNGKYFSDEACEKEIPDLTVWLSTPVENGGGMLPAKHHYIDYICEHCGGELSLDAAQKDAIKKIDDTVDHSDDEVIKLLAENAKDAIDEFRDEYNTVAEVLKIRNLTVSQIEAIKEIIAAAGNSTNRTVKAAVIAAKADISSAESIEDVISIRDEYLADIEKLTGTTHTFAEKYSFDENHHWHDSTCGHNDIVSGFGVHSFGEGVVDNDKKTTTYTCETCGYQKVVYNKDDEGEIISGTSYTGISLTLGSDISINFYMELSEEAIQQGTMTFDIGGRIVSLKGTDAKYNETKKKYYFQTPLNVLEMAETVKATFSCNGIDYIEEYSVEQYIEAILNGKYSDEMKALAKKIANYGYYAQSYLAKIHTNVTIGTGGYAAMTDKDSISVANAKTALKDYKVQVTGGTADLSLYGSTVYFDSATALNYYVTSTNGEPTVTAVNTVTGETKQVEIKLYKDNIYIVSVKDIFATELADIIKVTVNNTLVIEGSVFAYCKSVMNKAGQTDEAKNAMAAFYEYYDAAVKYADSLLPTHTVTFYTEPYCSNTEISVKHGKKVTKPTNPEAEGYTFGGWYKDEECSEQWNFDTDNVTDNTVIYALWIDNAKANAKAEVQAEADAAKDGINNLGWLTAEQKKYHTDAVDAEVTAVNKAIEAAESETDVDDAKSKAKSAIIGIKSNADVADNIEETENKNTAKSSVMYYETEKKASIENMACLTVEAKNGYKTQISSIAYSAYSAIEAAESKIKVDAAVMSAEKEFYSVISDAQAYRLVSFDMMEHGEQVSSQMVKQGDKITKPEEPMAEGYLFGGWYKNKECTEEWKFGLDTVKDNITLYAKWTGSGLT